jgi:hypothetical protein
MDEKIDDKGQVDPTPRTQNMMLRMVLVSLKAGCLTFLIAGGALVIGLILDIRQDTLPRWMLIFLIGSMPFTLGGIFLLIKSEIKKIRENGPPID